VIAGTAVVRPAVGALAAGRGRLVVGAHGGRAVLETLAARSPLRLLAPRNHGADAWVYTSTFGGGLVDGDVVGLDVAVREGAGLLLATQASTKVYRSRVGCTQVLDARVAGGASLVVLPDPVVCFADARYAQASRIDLGRGGSLLWVDGLSCGRAARGERWQFARYETRTRIERGGAPLVRDATVLDPAHGAVASRMGRWEALFTLFAMGPRFASLAADALAAEAGRRVPAGRAAAAAGDVLEVASPLACGEGAVVRIAATSVERATRALRARLARLPALLGDDPFARKW